jgi:hypothetical protein
LRRPDGPPTGQQSAKTSSSARRVLMLAALGTLEAFAFTAGLRATLEAFGLGAVILLPRSAMVRTRQ